MSPKRTIRIGVVVTAAVAVVVALYGFVLAPDEVQPTQHGHPDHGADHQHHEQVVRRVDHAERYRPTPMPDRIVLTWTADPKTTQTVTWRTSTEVGKAYAEFAVGDHGPAFTQSSKRVPAQTRVFKSDLSTAHVHTATMDGLEPGTTYAYRVGDGTNWSEWFHFRTEPAASEPFTFVYLGDAQTEIRSMWSRITREAFREAPRAAFFLHAGDLVNVANSDGEWGEWFEAGSFINATTPVIATPGNHEYVKIERPLIPDGVVLTEHFPMVFAFPQNGPTGLQSTVYYIDYGDLRVISLNSMERQDEQVEWLDRVLSKNDRKWTAVTFHHPIYSTGNDRDNPRIRRLWKPVLDRHAVDIVLNGHDHTYGRSGLVGGNPGRNVPTGTNARSEAGTVYVVSVSGPKMYDAKADPGIEYVRRAEETQLYQIIAIDGNELRYEARTALGDVYDAFRLVKREGQPNELVELPVEFPARRRPGK